MSLTRGGFIINTSDKLKELVRKNVIPKDYKLLTSIEINNKCKTLSKYFSDKSNLAKNDFNVICDNYDLVLETKVGLISFDKSGDMWKVPLNGKFITHLKYDNQTNFYKPIENIVLNSQQSKPLTVENILNENYKERRNNIMKNNKTEMPDFLGKGDIDKDILKELEENTKMDMEKSTDFNSNDNADNLKQSQDENEREAKRLEKQRKKQEAQAERDKVREAIVGDAPAQTLLWDYNYERGEFGAWIVKNAPRIKFSTAGTPVKTQDGNYVLNKEGKDNQDAVNKLNAKEKPADKYLEKEFKIVAKELKPSSVQGLILKVPAAGIPNYTELLSKQGLYEPDKNNQDMIYQVFTKSAAFAFLATYFRSKIKASPITHDGQKLDLIVESHYRSQKSKDDKEKSTLKSVSTFKLQGLGGRTFITRNNWVPRTIPLTMSFDELKKHPEDMVISNQLLFGSFFKVRGKVSQPPYEKLSTEDKEKLTKDIETGLVSSKYLAENGLSIPAWFSSSNAEIKIENPKIPIGYKNEKNNYVAYIYDVLNEDKVPQFPKEQTPDLSPEFAAVREFLKGSGLSIKDCIEKAFAKQSKPKDDVVTPVEVYRMYMKAVDDNINSAERSAIVQHTNLDVSTSTFESMQDVLKEARESIKK